MKLINTSAIAVLFCKLSAVRSSDAQTNQDIAEEYLRAHCMETDPDTQEFINKDKSYCESYFADVGPDGRGTDDGDDLGRKLKNLKMLVLWLQPEHRFARYCYYGCWCLPDEDHAEYTPAYGKPVDEVDSSCKRMAQCYECGKMDHGDTCESSHVAYKYELLSDEADGEKDNWKRSIKCLDNPVGKKACKRSICECDKKLAEDLRTNYGFWIQGHHQTQGDFDTSQCVVDHCTGPNCQARGPLACCGPHDQPRFPYRTNFGQRKCCGNKTYDADLQECCSDGEIKFMGAC